MFNTILAVATLIGVGMFFEWFFRDSLRRRGEDLSLYRLPLIAALFDGRITKGEFFILREVRERAGLSRWELAEKSCVPFRRIRSFEEGSWPPTVFEAKRLADALGVTVDELVRLPERVTKS